MRLIDADALIPIMKYTTTDNEIGVFPIRIGFEAIKGVIDEAPTIDAVEIVRCKDCINNDANCSGEENWCYKFGYVVDDDDFCSYGEKQVTG